MTTHCVNCGFNNPPGMRFCGNCGSRLAVTPAVTSEPSPASLGVLVGADLMERFRRAGLEAAGQRRNVTILFADLSGFTSLSERMDSEDVYELVQRFIRLLLNAVYKYEGIVDKITGDGIMALFGAPIAHENNAERAVRAALEMQDDVGQLSRELRNQLKTDLSMRVGLHSGTVIVGGIGSNLLMDYTAIGDTVNLAHRIEEAAPPGAILVSDAVFRQVRAIFDCQQISVLNPKGIAHPVMAYRVLTTKLKPGSVRGIDGLRAPMIGRDRELTRLKNALSTMLNRKQGQFVLITGEAGLGKSRLTTEFKSSLAQVSIRMMEGQSLAYRRSISYWIFQDVLYSYLGLPPNTAPLLVRERLTQNVYQAMGSQATEVVPYLEHLLGLPPSDPAASEKLRYLDAGQLRQQIFLALRDLLLLEAYRQPLLLVLEDLHWADDASLELLKFILESLLKAPIFILAISRSILPGPLTKNVEWAQQFLGERYQHIQLQNLSLNDSERLLFQLLTIPALPENLCEQILQRAAGIPFYLEEILRMLIDAGAVQQIGDQWRLTRGMESVVMNVPDTLQGLILTRFDRLTPIQRQILQVASVIGKNFSLPVLKGVLNFPDPGEVDRSLSTLLEREFIQPLASSVNAEYTFRHVLMSDAIYSTLLRRESSRLHGQVGQVIEALYPDQLDGKAELLAHHYRWSPRLDRALHYSLLAGDKAVRNNVIDNARQHYEAALGLLDQVEHTVYQELSVHMGMGDVLVFSGEYLPARQHYEAAIQACESIEGKPYIGERCALQRKIAKTFERQGDYDQALTFLKEAQQTLAAAPQSLPVEAAQTLHDIGWICFRRANFKEARQLLLEALNLVEDSNAYDVIASIYNRLGGVEYSQGNWEQAAGFLRKSIAIRESIGDLVGLATSFSNLGLLEVEMGEFDSALANLTRSYELKTRLGQAEGIALALNNLSWLRVQRGELEEARQALNEALELVRHIGYSSLLRQTLKNLGELYLTAQEWDQASEVLNEIAPALLELGAYDQLLDTYRLLGESALGAGDLTTAQGWAQKAQELIIQHGSQTEFSTIQRGELRRFMGMLALRMRDFETAGEYLRESAAIFQQLRSRLYQGRITFQLGALAEAQGDRRAARLHYHEAALLFQSVGAKVEEKRAQDARVRQ